MQHCAFYTKPVRLTHPSLHILWTISRVIVIMLALLFYKLETYTYRHIECRDSDYHQESTEKSLHRRKEGAATETFPSLPSLPPLPPSSFSVFLRSGKRILGRTKLHPLPEGSQHCTPSSKFPAPLSRLARRSERAGRIERVRQPLPFHYSSCSSVCGDTQDQWGV